MWAAANDSSTRHRRRRYHHENKRRRTVDGINVDDKNDSSSSDEDDSCSDDERSTTESIAADDVHTIDNNNNHGDNNNNIDEQSSTTIQRQQQQINLKGNTSNNNTQVVAKKKKKRKRKQQRAKQHTTNRREETAEATMARLKSSYSTAISAVGALHNVSKLYCSNEALLVQQSKGDASKNTKEDDVFGNNDNNKKGESEIYGADAVDNNNESSTAKDANVNEQQTKDTTTITNDQEAIYNTIQRVANAARSALEQSLLLDPIILSSILLLNTNNNETNNKKKNKSSSSSKGIDDVQQYQLQQYYGGTDTKSSSSAWLDTYSSSSSNNSNSNNQYAAISKGTKWSKLSSAHQNIISQITYLTLVNYADLLLCGCILRGGREKKKNERDEGGGGMFMDVLDKGAVSTLDILNKLFASASTSTPSTIKSSLWSSNNNDDDESIQRTLRLALSAYCDASELDSSDPTLWYKLACAARALGREIDNDTTSSSLLIPSNNNNGPPNTSYRCLERLALERGLSSLPRGVPPNRLIMRAWNEMERWDRYGSSSSPASVGNENTELGVVAHEAMDDDDITPQKRDTTPVVELVLNLPEYSWVTLGRILMQACQEGVSYGQQSVIISEDDEFGSPLVDIRISPLLAVPLSVLGKVCEYLDESDTICLMCTCKEISSAASSLRRRIAGETKQCTNGETRGDTNEATASSSTITTVAAAVNESTNAEPSETTATASSQQQSLSVNLPGGSTDSISPPRGPGRISPKGGRVSKRVRSQMLTSEKQTERKSKRGSVEYCLLAGALSCTAQNPYYNKLLKEEFTWKHLPQGIKKFMESLVEHSVAAMDSNDLHKTTTESVTSQLDQTNNAFVTPTSLNSFVAKWSRHNSGPRSVAESFLIHVSLNAGDVFEVEKTDSISSCVMDCFDMMIATAERKTVLMPWYGQETFKETGNNLQAALPVLAVNLLNAELRLKRCESHDIGSEEHQEDADVLAFMIPQLLMFVQAMLSNNGNGTQQVMLQLQCRCYWLASTYYLWIGRCCNDASIAKDAEDAGFDYLNKLMNLLAESSHPQKNLVINTQYLQSSHRQGDHWRKLSSQTLSKYKEHLQSSSIVSRARQRFQEIQNDMNGRSQSDDDVSNNNFITVDDKAKFASLGLELLERYDINSDKSNLDELLSDLLLLHEDHLLDASVSATSSGGSSDGRMHWGRLWTDIPSSSSSSSNAAVSGLGLGSSRPSIIQVLASSLIVSGEKIPSLFLVYSKLALTAIISRAQTVRGNSSVDAGIKEKNGDATNVDEDKSIEKAGYSKRDNLLVLLVNFLIDKMADMVESYTDEAGLHSVLETYIIGDGFGSLIFASLNMLPSVNNSALQMNLSRSSSRLVKLLLECPVSRQYVEKVECVYFQSLIKALTQQKQEFVDLTDSSNDKRLKKWQSQITSHAELVFFTANESAELLSLNPTVINEDGSASVSHLIRAITEGELQSTAAIIPLAHFTKTLLWFWIFISNPHDIVTSPTEKTIRDRLIVPITSCIIALCGSPGISVDSSSFIDQVAGKRDDVSSDKSSALSFSDYFDSEDSANGLFLQGDSMEEQRSRRVLLRKMCQLVQCISLVFKSVVKHVRNAETSPDFPSCQHGPFLPLVAVRVLSSLSEGIFSLFSEDVSQVVYPYGARECGNMIDNLLGKAYSHLHGFSFSSGDPFAPKSFSPESIKAATRLFRCIKRKYNDNRKTPPTKAFETVELALPPKDESEASKALKRFLFEAPQNIDIALGSTDDVPLGLPEWAFESDVDASMDKEQDEIEVLRRGVAHELAKGDIADLESPSDTDDQGLSAERELTQSHEMNMYQNFRAVLNDLCYNPNNVEGWVKLSECLGFKSEDICDRLVRIKDPYDSSEFCLNNKSKREQPATMSLEQLRTDQVETFQVSRENWKPFIGNDLLVYMKYPWSNLSSLETFSKEVGSTLQVDESNKVNTTDKQHSDHTCWKEIQLKFDQGDYLSWANSWAGMFVTALRFMRLKALLIARYLAKRSRGGSGMHPSEVCEDVGTALYSDLMASTVYGYPMHVMPDHEKRRIAELSNFYFRESVELSTSSEYTQKCQTVSHELRFMIGKCYEKIASTLKEEKYQVGSGEDLDQPTRLYETTMNDAISNYAKASEDALKAEKSSGGGPDKTCLGGSSHGAIEYLYRLHASRFKVMLSAIRRSKEECKVSELEAFRITSAKWYDESNESSSSSGVRGKTWDVFVDCVDAFSHCRREIPVFHRAAYRLAQAFNYAPLFHDPDVCDLNIGSKQAVPVMKGYRVRGLDTGSCAESANVVISKLFDKKRSQLCAVWVTTSSCPSPFEVLNDSLRKYDALRLKYIMAYIDCMRSNEKGKDKIETLWNWTATSNQDMAGFYVASALLRGGDPGKHGKQSLLTGDGFIAKVKRHCSSALAEMILRDLAMMKKSGIDSNGRMKLTAHFNLAYKLYLRLNASSKEVADYTTTKEPLSEAEAFCKCYLSIQSGYRISSINFDGMDSDALCSILEGAVSKGKLMVQEAKVMTLKKEKGTPSKTKEDE